MRSYHALAEDVFWLGVDGCPWVVNTTGAKHRVTPAALHTDTGQDQGDWILALRWCCGSP